MLKKPSGRCRPPWSWAEWAPLRIKHNSRMQLPSERPLGMKGPKPDLTTTAVVVLSIPWGSKSPTAATLCYNRWVLLAFESVGFDPRL